MKMKCLTDLCYLTSSLSLFFDRACAKKTIKLDIVAIYHFEVAVKSCEMKLKLSRAKQFEITSRNRFDT